MTAPALTSAQARRYVARRRALFIVVLALFAGVVGWRISLVRGREARIARCEQQRASTSALVVPVTRRFDGLVLVRAHSEPEPLPPAQGDVVVTEYGTYLVGERRVLALDASCEEAVP